ncbi:hypothetical protein DICVIV_14211, partial [Dictyocaulus viviparus]
GIVTGICRRPNAGNCAIAPANGGVTAATAVPEKYRTVEGTLRTTNAIMVYWDDNKWRSIFDRVKYFLARGRMSAIFSNVSIRFS